MSQVITDAKSRFAALDPSRSFIVQAPAGSGKTELLTRRILTLLAEVDEPEEILAITFTRKAASEMRQRVLSTLLDAQNNTPVANDYQQQGRDLAQAVLLRDQNRNWQLLQNPSRLSMQTIDSLCAVLTRQLPVTSNFGAELGVLEDARRLYLVAAQRCIEENLVEDQLGYLELQQLLVHLDNNVERVQGLLAGMLANRDQWLRHYSQAGSRGHLEQDLQALVSARFDKLEELVPAHVLTELPALLQMAADAVIGLDLDKPAQHLGGMDAIPRPAYSSGLTWQLLADFLLTNNSPFGFRKRIARTEGFPVSPADAEDLNLTVAELKQRKKQFVDWFDEMKTIDGLESMLREIRDLPLTGYTDKQWTIMESLLKLLSLCVAELHLVFRRTHRSCSGAGLQTSAHPGG